MKRIIQLLVMMTFVVAAYPQSLTKKIEDAITAFEEDPQMKYALLGFHVEEQKTGKVIVSNNGETGMVPASAQKIITAATAFDILGSGYRYQTDVSYNGNIAQGVLNGTLYVMGYGDPTLGSDRYGNTKEQVVMNKWVQALKKAGIKQINGNVVCFDKTWETQTLPGGWIWDDIGNYYGAGASAINWRENEYDVILKSGSREGDRVSIVSYSPKPYNVTLNSELTTGKPGSGDNAWIYLAPYSTTGFIRGTIPPNQTAFKISGSLPHPAMQLKYELSEELKQSGIAVNTTVNTDEASPILTTLYTHNSPSLDSIVHWFFRKSINLYGEALVKTIGFQKKGKGSTEVGINIIKNYWKDKGIDVAAINMNDGSGLSPLNRVTPEAMVRIMQYARTRPWFNSFRSALPEFNGIRMKSGTMTGVKSFTGYVNGYTFAIIVNNYSGSSSEITGKIYKLLDLLK